MSASKTLQLKLISWAEKEGKKNAIIEADTGKIITYHELFFSVNALETYLGPKPKRILVALASGITNSVVWLTALTGGHLLIPVSPYLTEYEYTKIKKKYKPDLVIDDKTVKKIEDAIQKCSNDTLTNPPKSREGKVFLSTSGSTGTPKGIILSTSQVVITADNIRKGHKITKKDRGFTCLPFFHVNAPVVSLVTSMLSGSTIIIAQKYSTSHFWEWIEKYDPTWISIVPTIVAMLLSTDKPSFLNHSSLRFIRTASEPLPAENLKRFEEKFQFPVIETYGISEAASTITANPIPPKKHKPGSVGLPLGVSLKICEVGSNKILPKGKTGEVCIKGRNVIKKYVNNQSKDSFSNGWFRTGDLGFIDQDGYIHLTGRIKDIIIRGGENITPREIEEVLLSYPNIKEATVVGQPDPIYGEKIVAFVTLSGKNKGLAKKLKKYASQKLTPQKVPEKVCLLNELPRNKTGKVNKQALRELLSFNISLNYESNNT